MTIVATYINPNTFTVEGNQTGEFHIGRRVKLIGGVNWFGTIANAVFTTATTITLTEASDDINSTLTEAFYGIVSAKESGTSMPTHNHEGDEGSGGQLDHEDLTNIGTNTHADIDSYIISSNASIAVVSDTADENVIAIGLNTTHRETVTGNPHVVTLEEARTAANTLSGNVDFNNNNIVDIKGIGFQGGQELTWNSTDNTLNIPTGLGPVLQVGQETQVKIYNNTGFPISNGAAVYPKTEIVNGYSTIGLARTDSFETISTDYGLATMDIPDGDYGFVTTFGRVRGINTNSFLLGDVLWISSTMSGGLTKVKPEFPNYAIQIGIVLVKDALNGEIFVTGNDSVHETTQNFWNGTFRESFDFLVDTGGATVIGTLSPSNGNVDMTMLFSDGFSKFDTSPPAEVLLTPGTDDSPLTNYVYIPKTTKVLTVDTSKWPSFEHIKVAEIVLRSAAATVIEGALRNQNWNDYIEDSVTFQGQLSHITQAIRQKVGATWKTGTEGLSSIDTGPTPDDVWITVTAGKVMQIHDQAFPAFDTETGSGLHIVNHFTTPYLTTSNLNIAITDALGTSLNNTSFSFVLWGVANKSGEPSHLMINLPTGSYSFIAPINAVSDADNHSVYSIPTQFDGVGFLIARFTYTYKNDAWALEDTEDLRGKIPNTTAGGGGGGGGVTTFLGLTDTPNAYTGQAGLVPAVNIGETGLEFITAGAVSSVFTRTGDVVATTGDYTAAQVTNAFDRAVDDADDVDDATSANKFTTASDISKLAGIEALAEVNNISDANATDLTDAGDSTLHYHATDRNRTNHTGTQTASTISDFDTEVSNNTDVSANTAKTTNATHTGEVTGSAALTIANSVVDEANLKLDTGPTNDFVLTADSTKSGGMKWGSPTMKPNLISEIDGSIEVWAAVDAATENGLFQVVVWDPFPDVVVLPFQASVTNGVTLRYGTGITEFSTDDTLAGNSDNAVPTEKAVKTYVDGAGGTSDKIEEGNSGVEVVDTGVGYVDIILDGTERARFASLGRLVVGDTLSSFPTSSPSLYAQNSSGQVSIGGRIASASASHWPFIDLRRSRGTVSSPTVVVAGDWLASLAGAGYSTSGWIWGGLVGIKVDGTPSTGAVPTKVTFETTETSTGARTERLVIRATGCVEPGSDDGQDFGSSSKRWTDIYATNATIQTSDKRLKDNIVTSELGLDFICKLEPKSFKWKDYTVSGTRTISIDSENTKEEDYIERHKYIRTHYGMIAQDVVTTISGLGKTNKDFAGIIYDEETDRYGLRYQEFIAPMIKAIQELKEENNELKSKLTAIEERLLVLEG